MSQEKPDHGKRRKTFLRLEGVLSVGMVLPDSGYQSYLQYMSQFHHPVAEGLVDTEYEASKEFAAAIQAAAPGDDGQAAFSASEPRSGADAQLVQSAEKGEEDKGDKPLILTSQVIIAANKFFDAAGADTVYKKALDKETQVFRRELGILANGAGKVPVEAAKRSAYDVIVRLESDVEEVVSKQGEQVRSLAEYNVLKSRIDRANLLFAKDSLLCSMQRHSADVLSAPVVEESVSMSAQNGVVARKATIDPLDTANPNGRSHGMEEEPLAEISGLRHYKFVPEPGLSAAKVVAATALPSDSVDSVGRPAKQFNPFSQEVKEGSRAAWVIQSGVLGLVRSTKPSGSRRSKNALGRFEPCLEPICAYDSDATVAGDCPSPQPSDLVPPPVKQKEVLERTLVEARCRLEKANEQNHALKGAVDAAKGQREAVEIVLEEAKQQGKAQAAELAELRARKRAQEAELAALQRRPTRKREWRESIESQPNGSILGWGEAL